MNFNSILIGSEDPARLTAYYTKLFGKPGWDDGGYTGWQIGSGGVSIGPHSEVHGMNKEPGRVIREPYNFESAPDAWVATFADPDDNYFQLVSPMGDTSG
jgi:hypothetical protein